MPKVSVIVPVYNTELYVERAIISLMEQTLQEDVQFIIIDDGSKDNSLNIIKQVIARYPAREGQVTLISRENRGVAATRAQGMELAAGDYVIHLDSDDWAELNWLEAMYTKAIEENADVVVCDFSLIYHHSSKVIHQKVFNKGVDCVRSMILNGICNANWNKLIRLDFIHHNDIAFKTNLNMGEDFVFSLKTLFKANKVSHINESLYNYNQENETALTKKYTKKDLCDIKQTVSLTESYFKDNGVYDDFHYYVLHLKLNVKSISVLNAINIEDVVFSLNLYPETSIALFFSSRHWRLKIFTVLYFLKLKFLLRFLNSNI
ncbi:putative glycosyltransferase EpsH [compost metagenome]